MSINISLALNIIENIVFKKVMNEGVEVRSQ